MALACSFCTFLAGAAEAQVASPAVPVFSGLSYESSSVSQLLAPRAYDFEPGVRMGSFLVTAAASTGVSYDDNVFAQPYKTGDWSNFISGDIIAASDWSRHGLLVSANVGTSFHENSSEDQPVANLSASGLIDVYRDFYFRLSGNYSHAFEPRGTGNSLASLAEPITYQKYGVELLAHKTFNRVWIEASVAYSDQNYDDAQVQNGNVVVPISQDFRSGPTYDLRGRVGYEFSPKTSLFLEGGSSRREADDVVFNGEDYSVLAGIRYEFTRLVNSEFAVGYLNQSSQGGLDDVSTWTYRANVGWDVTRLLRVGVTGSRRMGSPSRLTAADSNTVMTEIGVRADYAWKDDVTIYAGVGNSWTDYVDIGGDESSLMLTSGIDYQFKPWLDFWVNYTYQTTTINVIPNADYDRNIVSAGIRARY